MKKNNNHFDIRLRFGNSYHGADFTAPHLLEITLKSYKNFLYGTKNEKSGLEKEFLSIFPIYNKKLKIKIKYIRYILGKPKYHSKESLQKAMTYASPLLVKVLLCIYPYHSIDKDDSNDKTIYVEDEIYICDLPLMTESGTFIINGNEKAVIAQIQKCPGVFFGLNNGIYYAKIIPHRGSWLDFEFDIRDNIYFRIDKKRKMPITYLLRALNYSTEDMLNLFDQHIRVKLSNINKKIYIMLNHKSMLDTKSDFDIIHNNILYVKKGETINMEHIKLMIKKKIKWVQVNIKYIIGKIIAKKYINNDKIICEANTEIKEIVLRNLLKNNINEILIVKDEKNYISKTLKNDKLVKNKITALKQINYNINSGKFNNKDINIIEDLFFNDKKYDLSDVGRIKFNQSFEKMNVILCDYNNSLTRQDIIVTLQKLINIRNGIGNIDDIDHLGNKLVKNVGDMVQTKFSAILYKLSSIITDKTYYLHVKRTKLKPKDLIHFKSIAAGIKEFYLLNSLSQFLDQTNPLSELTHKRRISSLGPGGVNRDRATFEIRDIHPTHYGRICPIETPEGPNIGLINSFSQHVKLNKYGFLLTPYIKVIKGHVSKKIEYLSPMDEYNYIIAHSVDKLDKNNNLIYDKLLCRYNYDTKEFNKKDIHYIDVSPTQIFSVGANTIPFMDNNDANRALMGANMQRQAVPLLKTESPLVGTGVEKQIAVDSKAIITAKRNGIVHYVDSLRIIIKNDHYCDIYKLNKNLRSNQNTCINQKPIVMLGDKVKKGDIIADGPATYKGELALGKNLRVAFMSWHGYSFEDSVVISEKVIQEQTLTSVHLYRYECLVKDNRLGIDKVTKDLPYAKLSSISHLDETGIVYIGSVVKEGDILVGKISPTNKTPLPPEEQLVKTIFYEPMLYFKDTSFRVPKGMSGTVVDIQFFDKEGEEHNVRIKLIMHILIQSAQTYANTIQQDILYKMKNILNYDEVQSNNTYKNMLLKTQINFKDISSFLSFKFNNDEINVILQNINKHFIVLINQYKMKLLYLFQKINNHPCDNIPTGVKQIIRITIAHKKNIKPGDKISGRHGNKGVIAKVCRIEDMPYDEDGNTIDVILNPLGVPSRMNVGQLLETKLGLLLKNLGNVIKKLLSSKKIEELRGLLQQIYSYGCIKINIYDFSDEEIINIGNQLINGVPVSNPVFNGVKEEKINEMFKLISSNHSGQIYLYDGYTGERFERPISVGYMYMLKLNHLVDDKIHARSTGNYSIVTQQPLGGKSQFGGQRFGEMEVWALEAYGASNCLQEMLTVKSDDLKGREFMYKNILKDNNEIFAQLPESFIVLIKELMALGINIELKDTTIEKNVIQNNEDNLISNNQKVDVSDENVFTIKPSEYQDEDPDIDFKKLDKMDKVLPPKKKREKEEIKEIGDKDYKEYLKKYEEDLNKKNNNYIEIIDDNNTNSTNNANSKNYIAIYTSQYITIKVKK